MKVLYIHKNKKRGDSEKRWLTYGGPVRKTHSRDPLKKKDRVIKKTEFSSLFMTLEQVTGEKMLCQDNLFKCLHSPPPPAGANIKNLKIKNFWQLTI